MVQGETRGRFASGKRAGKGSGCETHVNETRREQAARKAKQTRKGGAGGGVVWLGSSKHLVTFVLMLLTLHYIYSHYILSTMCYA
jgi:hypothetical protein